MCAACGAARGDTYRTVDGKPVCTDEDACLGRWVEVRRAQRVKLRKLDAETGIETRGAV
jgi:hypothetical protein